jgi:hypothetical protein
MSMYSFQHWQQRALLAERRLAEFHQRSASPNQISSPRLSEAGLDLYQEFIPLEVLSTINSKFGASIQVCFTPLPAALLCHFPYSAPQAHDIPAATATLNAFHSDFVELQREHEALQSKMAGDSACLSLPFPFRNPPIRSNR